MKVLDLVELEVGKLYQFTYEGCIPIQRSPEDILSIGKLGNNIPFMIIEVTSGREWRLKNGHHESYDRYYLAKILVADVVGYVFLDPRLYLYPVEEPATEDDL